MKSMRRGQTHRGIDPMDFESMHNNTHIHTQTDTHVHRYTHIQKKRETHRPTDRATPRYGHRKSETQTDLKRHEHRAQPHTLTRQTLTHSERQQSTQENHGCSRSPAPGTKSAALGTAAPGTAALKVRHCGTAALKVRHCGTDNKFLIFSIFNVFFYFCQCGVGWFTVCYAKIILKLCNFIKIIGLKQF